MRVVLLLPAIVVSVASCGRIGFDPLQGAGPGVHPGGEGGGGGGASLGGSGALGGAQGGASGMITGGRSAGAGSGGQPADAGGIGSLGGAGGGGASGAGGLSDAGGPGGASTGTDGGGATGMDGGVYTCTPGAAELCDGRDNDCDLEVDESACGVNCEGHASAAYGYMLCNGNYKWDEAKAACEAAGLVLAPIDSVAESEFINSFAFGTRSTDIWVGGSDAAAEGDWRWTDGTAFWSGIGSPNGSAVGGAYTNWLSSEPNNISNSGLEADCLSIRQDDVWVDQGCNYFERMLCRTP